MIAPVVFTDGSSLFRRYLEKYIVHKKGLFVIGPSGSGKTYFVNHQIKKDWVDGDKLWIESNAQPRRAWWTEGLDVIFEVDQRSDVITQQARKLGLWVIGASNYWLKPDGIVIPPWEVHKQYIVERERHNYDGGATTEDFDQVLAHRKSLERQARKGNIPIFQSVSEAAETLSFSVE